MLLPPDLREWVRPDDMVHFVIEAVEGMNLPSLKVNRRGTGSEQFPPKMMLELVIYCYANGIFSSRRIERATYRDIAVRFLTGDTHPDHDTICTFRGDNFDVVGEAFLQVLQLARELGLLKVGTISVDGTKMLANASKHNSLRYDRAGELVEQLEQEIQGLLKQAEQADQTEANDGQALPEEIARRETLKAKLEQARRTLEARAQVRAEDKQPEYEKLKAQREQRPGRSKGKHPKPPEANPPDDQQINLTDEDSSLMRKNKRSEYLQAYNAQAAVDAEGSQLILGCHVSTCASDSNELMGCVGDVAAEVGRVENVLADSGYTNEEQANQLETAGITPYVAVGRDGRRPHDFRPKSPESAKPKELTSEWKRRMKERLDSDVGRRLYRLRKMTVEPVFGIIKEVMGIRRFLLRGLTKVEGEWELVCLAYNVRRLFTLKNA
jgi:transposase